MMLHVIIFVWQSQWAFSIEYQYPMASFGAATARHHKRAHICAKTSEKYWRMECYISGYTSDLEIRCVSLKNERLEVLWKYHYHGRDYRFVIGYYLYYREAPDTVTLYQGRDACNDNMWVGSCLPKANLYQSLSLIFRFCLCIRLFVWLFTCLFSSFHYL